jgi:hypothetical protein
MADADSPEAKNVDIPPAFQKGRTSPALALPEAAEGLRQVYAQLGKGPYSRDLVATALGHKPGSGTANSKVGALTHYGLLDRTGSSYSVSEIGTKLLMPENDDEPIAALADAAKSPGLYAELVEAFAGKALPHLLPNILARNYGVLPKSSEEVAQTFRATMEYAGLLRNGILYSEPQPSSATPANGPDSTEQMPDVKVTARILPKNEGTQRYTIPLGKDGRLAVIDLPVPVSAADLSRVRAWVEFMIMVTVDEQPDEACAPA